MNHDVRMCVIQDTRYLYYIVKSLHFHILSCEDIIVYV